ncbi:hypothetical protein HanPSC8_Chr09g0403981 [Helianthus annuus]|nr:hypothetical protein HanPSC8_Chr09g0403981 [Helianthus annuus]
MSTTHAMQLTANWLQIELENAENAANAGNDVQMKKNRDKYASHGNIILTMALLLREENPWLVPTEDHIYELMEPTNIELHATAMLSLPSGECMYPDPTLCTALISAFYSSLSDQVVFRAPVNVSISSKDKFLCRHWHFACMATESDGLPNELAMVVFLLRFIAAGVKGMCKLTTVRLNKIHLIDKHDLAGELVGFQVGVTMESETRCLVLWKLMVLWEPATYILQGLGRRCCVPENYSSVVCRFRFSYGVWQCT